MVNYWDKYNEMHGQRNVKKCQWLGSRYRHYNTGKWTPAIEYRRMQAHRTENNIYILIEAVPEPPNMQLVAALNEN